MNSLETVLSWRPRIRISHSARVVAAVCMAVTLGQLGLIAQPFQVGALIDGAHKTSVEAGSLMAVQMCCYAAALLVIAKVADRIGPAFISLSGLVVSVVAFAAMFAVTDSAALYLSSALAGAGQGAVFAGALAAGARTPNPERTYGLAGTMGILVAVAFISGISAVRELLGARGVFPALCVVLAVLAPAMWDLGREAHSTRRASGPAVDRGGAVAVLGMFVLFGVGSGAIYTFAERVGTHLNLSQQRIGVIFTVCTAAGAVGSMASAWAGLRWGRTLPLYVTLLVTGVASLALGAAWNSWIYAAGLMVFQLAYTACAPYQFGAAADLDRSGRLVALVGGVHFMAWAAGSQIGGLLAQYFSLAAIGVFSLVMSVLAAMTVPLLSSAFARRAMVAAT
jgi:MFS family permease